LSTDSEERVEEEVREALSRDPSLANQSQSHAQIKTRLTNNTNDKISGGKRNWTTKSFLFSFYLCSTNEERKLSWIGSIYTITHLSNCSAVRQLVRLSVTDCCLVAGFELEIVETQGLYLNPCANQFLYGSWGLY